LPLSAAEDLPSFESYFGSFNFSTPTCAPLYFLPDEVASPLFCSYSSLICISLSRFCSYLCNLSSRFYLISSINFL
jgi:hypothetical protein